MLRTPLSFALPLVLSLALTFTLAPFTRGQHLTRSQLVTSLLGNGSGYDETLRPYLGTTTPVSVQLWYRLNLIYAVSSADEQFSLSFFMTERWTDPRLAFASSLFSLPYGDSLRLPSAGVWRPDTFFYNSVKCATSDSLMKLDPTGSGVVTWTRHMTCTFYTPFDLTAFPFDSQSFPIKRQSFAYNSTELVYTFPSSTSCFQPDPRLDYTNALWTLVSYECASVDSDPTKGTFDSPTQLIATLNLDRLFKNYVLKMILPMFLLVIVASMSYFIDPAVAPARVTLSVTIVLSVSTFNILVSQDLPKINYSTLLDWFVWKCFLFAILTVSEFAIVNHLLVGKVYEPRVARLVDDFFQWTIPVVWGLSNLIYWPIVSETLDNVFGFLMAVYIFANAYRIFWCYRNEKEGMITPLRTLYYYIKNKLDEADQRARHTYQQSKRHLRVIGIHASEQTGHTQVRARRVRRPRVRRSQYHELNEPSAAGSTSMNVIVTPPSPRSNSVDESDYEEGKHHSRDELELVEPSLSLSRDDGAVDEHESALGRDDDGDEESHDLSLDSDDDDDGDGGSPSSVYIPARLSRSIHLTDGDNVALPDSPNEDTSEAPIAADPSLSH